MLQARPKLSHGMRALPAVVFLMTAMAGVSAGVVSASLFRHASIQDTYEQEQAFKAASAALELAILELQEGTDSAGDGIGVVREENEGGQHSVEIAPPFTGPGEYTLQATGEYEGATQSIEAIVTSNSVLAVGLFGTDSIELSGGFLIDSYDSTQGRYDPLLNEDHAGEVARVVSNGDITLGGDTIWGAVTPGPDGLVLGDASNVFGATAPSGSVEAHIPVVYDPSLDSSGPSTATGTLTSGTYRYDSITGSQDVLRIEGNVTLYVDGPVRFAGQSGVIVTRNSTLTIHHGEGHFDVSGGALVNENEDPAHLTLFSASTGVVTTTGSAQFFGIVCAPAAKFEGGEDSEMFGAVLARSIKLSGPGAFHCETGVVMPRVGDDVFRVKLARNQGT